MKTMNTMNTMKTMNTDHPCAPVFSGALEKARIGTTRLLFSTGFLATAALAGPASAHAEDSNAAVAISSRVSQDYVRQQLPGGSYEAETFAFGKGGIWAGAAKDDTIDKMDFMDVARAIALPLASQSYVSTRDPKATKLLIMVYWGTTHAPAHANTTIAMQNLQSAANALSAANGGANTVRFDNNTAGWTKVQMYNNSLGSSSVSTPAQETADNAMTGAMALVAVEDRARDQANFQNASMLGYDSWWNQTANYKGTPLEFRQKEMVDELEEGRYFVVLMAYDFQMMWKEKKPKLLWETRYSIRERGNAFDRQLAAMTQQASGYFGRDSDGLVHKALPEGRVDIGAQKVLAYEH
jgi:hypothetical protein